MLQKHSCSLFIADISLQDAVHLMTLPLNLTWCVTVIPCTILFVQF